MRLSAELERKCLQLAGDSQTAPIGDEYASEKAFQADVIKFAKRNGWKCFHVHDSRKSESGWPDLVLVRERVIVRELKTETGIVGAEQANWIEVFQAAGIDASVWRPSQWAQIVETLMAGPI